MGWQRFICLTWLVVVFSFCWLPVDGWTACTPAPSGMVSWWSGDNNALDLIGTNEGTLVNGATYAAGIVGQSFSFDGVDDSVSLPNDPLWDFGTNSFSIDAWFKTSTSGLGNIIRYDTGTAGSGFWGIRLTASGHLEFLIADSSRTEVSITTDNPYADGSWHFVAAVRDGENGKLKIYIDGSPAATEVSDGRANIIGAVDAFPSIGAGSGGGEFFSGLVDEVEIFNRALSAQEIAAIYNAGATGKCSPKSLTVIPSGTGSGSVTGNGLNCSLNSYNLTVTPSGTGSGSVTGNGIDCVWNGSSSGACSVSLDYNTPVSLTAAPNAGSAFSGWSGGTGSEAGCNDTGACAFNMTEASSIGSIFSRKSSIYLPLILRP